MNARPPTPEDNEGQQALDRLRGQLDAVDDRICNGIAARFALTREIGVTKKRWGFPMMAPERITAVQTRVASFAHSQGVPVETVSSIFSLLIADACHLEDAIIAKEAQTDIATGGVAGANAHR